VRTGHHLDPHSKDSVKIALSHWIVELGEIGGTMRRSDQDALKAFLSQTVDNIRLPYADAESVFRRRTVFVGSVNEGEFLSDPTGSSRYWVLPVKRLDHEHHIDMQQVFAQAYAAWKQGETHFMAQEEMVEVQQNNTRFQVTDPVTDALMTHLAFSEMQTNPDKVVWVEWTPSQIARLAQLEPGRFASSVGRALHRISGATQMPRTTKARKWRVPIHERDAAFAGE
jgi:predicted P-loop ATPase